VKRGEVWLVDFGQPSGPEQAGKRPAIIMQADDITAEAATVIVIPLTTNMKRLAMPSSRLLPAGEAGQDRESVVLCHQMQVRGKTRLLSRIGELSGDRLTEVEEHVLNALGI